MKLRHLLFFGLLYIFLPAISFAQNLFSEKIGICSDVKYCMDCGAPKATVDPFVLNDICDRMNLRYNFKGGYGSITFQVLVDSIGNSCVLSHTDVSHNQLSRELMVSLNTCIWRPARVDGKKVNASVNVMFTIADGRIRGEMVRLDLTELKPADNPVVYNKQYQYQNPLLSSYNFTALTKYNSPLPDNVSQASIVDKTDTLWYATTAGLVKFDGNGFFPVNGTNSPFAAAPDVSAIAVDKDNYKWIYANANVYMYNNTGAGWQIFNPEQFKIGKPYSIITTATGEVFMPNSKGLLILRNGKFRLIDNQVIWQMPSNNVYYAYYDKRGRLWIGTSKGSVMIDRDQKVTSFNKTNTPLANTCITNVTEDDKGNLYFSLLACENPGNDNDEEGLAIMTADGKWSHYNDKNSGMPANHVNALLFDKLERVLWLAVDKAGLVRFDLKGGWENYHNGNSPVPGPNVTSLAQDNKGLIYVATTNGLLMMMKKGAGQ
ncbi:hypothetical protein HQ865_01835 [Mucilaginibacter mali]|uniref:Two component regulator with propeller domain n=1 Tax=Mucilaginibacter mali TaxID=2740462 RepID=A0A7D4PRW3_9SPHI|nr:two-component regulator propeller domain-containing protein [Mucilaginibacter mali]QKJ28548.1 hypothetical protein HQ865_01835 [Mucilaginibacter mali]